MLALTSALTVLWLVVFGGTLADALDGDRRGDRSGDRAADAPVPLPDARAVPSA